MKKIILMPAGGRTLELLKRPMKSDVECVFLCDNNPEKQGETLEGYRVVPPKKICEVEFDQIILITKKFEVAEELRKELSDLGVDGRKVAYTYGVSSSYTAKTILDEYFEIEKKETIPFERKPAVIYREYKGETYKSHERRVKEGFYDKYCQGEGIDIGYGADIIKEGCCGWDIRNGDAQYLEGIEDESFDFAYSSHCLEHVYDVRATLKNWFRIIRPGGYLIIAIPERDLYEKKKMLPSRWNLDHKHMFLLGRKEEPDTLDIMEEIRESLNNYTIVYAKTCDYGHTIDEPLKHSNGEYQIEIVIRKQEQ